MVVYQALYGDYRFYVRPLEMFMEKVDKIKYPQSAQEYRFELVNGDMQADNSIAPATPSPIAKDIKPEIISAQETVRVSTDDNDNAVEEEETVDLDKDVIRFLDSDTYEERLEILMGMKYKITDQMIDIMSTVIDIEICSGDINKRYEDFKNALMTRKHYEGVRLR